MPKTEKEIRAWIDNASYEELLRLWRNAPPGHPYFQDEVGDYYSKIMAEKRDAVGHEAAVRASKSIGWEG
jgi:hypothetical protein